MKEQNMTSAGYQVVSKGMYPYPQAEHFVTVREYVVLKWDGDRFLLLRLSNDLDVSLDSVTCAVVQLNAHGDVTERTQVTFRNLTAPPATIIAPGEAIPLRGSGGDFRVQILFADSGAYRYTWEDGRVAVSYLTRQPWIYRNGEKPGDGKGQSLVVRSVLKKFSVGLPGLVAVLACLVLLMINLSPYLPDFAGPIVKVWSEMVARLSALSDIMH